MKSASGRDSSEFISPGDQKLKFYTSIMKAQGIKLAGR